MIGGISTIQNQTSLFCIVFDLHYLCRKRIEMRYITTLTIAGSDSCGGAGIQADIKTMTALGVYAASVITAVTLQNTQGVYGVEPVSAQAVEGQICAVMDDVVVDAVKVGMLGDASVMRTVARCLRKYKPNNIVVDPVMISTSGHALMEKEAVGAFVDEMLPLATLLTPNIPEAECLSGIKIGSADDMDQAAMAICGLGCKAVLIKGGHLEGSEKVDKLYVGGKLVASFCNVSVETRNTHGTGCTLSSAIASFLARGEVMVDAVCHAVEYLHGAIEEGKDMEQGKGHGPVCHSPLFRCADDTHPTKRLEGMSLQFISHYNCSYTYADGIEQALKGGCRWVQLRMKDATDEEFMAEARRVKELCTRYGAVFIIDDKVGLVKATGADGVHLGKNDMPVDEARKLLGAEYIIGGTANTMDDVERLYRAGADYIGCGPFRFTTTKKNLSPVLGLDGYRDIVNNMRRKGISLPLVAIGGILPSDVREIMNTGVSGIAVSGAVLNAAEPVGEMERFCGLIKSNIQ